MLRKQVRQKVIALGVAVALALSACQEAPPQPPTPTEPPARPAEATTTPGPTATPRPPGNPVLVDRQPAQGEELAVDQPIILAFDQAMDRASVEQALTIQAVGAPLVGAPDPVGAPTLEWRQDNVVAVRPAQGWDRAARYSVSLRDTARSARGLSLARPVQFQVNTIGYLAVAQTIPADGASDVGADNLITVLFNRPVVPLTGLEQQASLPGPVSFEPAIEGAGEWLNTSIYVFRPSRPLAAGVTYVGRVAAGLQDITGALLQDDYTWSFSVAAPVVKAFDPPNGGADVDLRQPISITFSQKMDHASAEAAFSIDPPVRGSFRWADEVAQAAGNAGYRGEDESVMVGVMPQGIAPAGEVMAFVPAEDYQRGVTYRVTIARAARAAVGDATLRGPAGFTFRTIENPGVAATTPADGAEQAESTAGFNIRFSAPVLPETILPNLTFDPPVSLTGVYTYYDPFEKRFYLNVDLKPSTTYRVTIGGGIADKYGAQIGRDTVVRFTTAALSPYAALRADTQIGTYNASRPTRLFASYRNVSRLDFELARLSLREFYLLTGSPNAWQNWRDFRPSDAQVVRRWSVRAQTELNTTFLYEIDLPEKGQSLPPGVYMLTLSAPEPAARLRDYQPERHLLVVSNQHVALKQGEYEALAWVTDLNSGQPVAGAPVTFYDRAFAEVAAAQTDPDGKVIARYDQPMPLYEAFYAVVGEPGQDVFSIGYNNWDRGIAPWDFNLNNRYGGDPFNVYVYTDRPIYRPGQMVYFKGIARADDDARYSLIANMGAVNYTIDNDQGQQVFSATAPLDEYGAFTGAFALDNSAATGFYYINVCVPDTRNIAMGYKGGAVYAPASVLAAQSDQNCRSYGVGFQVAAYRAPEFEVTVTTDKSDYQAGDTLSATLDARYFFGGNVANAKVEWTLYARDYFFDRYTGEGWYSWGDYDFFYRGVGFNEQIANGTGTTDAAGRLSLNLPADLSQRQNSAVFSLEVSVTDLDDQSVSARASAVVHKSSHYVGIAPEVYVGATGEPATMNVIAVDWQGRPLAGKPVVVTFYQREWYTTQIEDPAGYREFTSVPSDTQVSRVSVTTGPNGKATAVFTPALGGEYYIKASGADEGSLKGPVASTSFYVSAQGAYVSWRVANNDRIELRADKQDYKVGETVRLLVPSPFSGTVRALVTVERGRFLSSRVVTLDSNSAIIEVPVESAFAPNAYISVLLVKGVDESNDMPAYKLGYTGITVDPGEFKLSVEIKTDKTIYKPRDTVTYDIRVTDAGGRPVQAQLSLAVVDKAVLSLADPNTLPIEQAFYGLRGLGIRTADSLSVNVDRVTARIVAETGKGGGGGGLAGALEGLFVRQNFKDTAAWEGIIATDANGVARAQVTLPDNLTTWVADVRAVTRDTLVGQATHEILSTKPLLVRPVTPRFFVVGDSVTLGAVVNNNTENALAVEVSLAARGVRIDTPASARVNVPAKRSARVDWTVTVEDAPSAELTFTARGGGQEDSSKPGLATAPNQGIPILRYVAPETVATAGDVSEPGRKLEVIALPARLDTGQGSLDIEVNPSLAAVIRNTLERLREYPYEDAETTASRLLVSLALGEDTGADVARHTQRLLGSQRSDGGWGWWMGDASNANITAYALLALARAQQAGYAVDVNMTTRAREFLVNALIAPNWISDAGVANQQAFLLYALTEAGMVDSGRLGALYENREKLGHYGKALLAMSLDIVQPGDARIQTLLSDIASAAIAGAAGVFWQEARYDFFSFDSTTRSTAIVLNALAQLDPDSALTTNAVRWLMTARNGSAWDTNQENAWAVMALSAWREAVGDATPDYTWRVLLNDASVLNGAASPANAARSESLSVPVAQLARGQGNDLVFERGAGEGRLYYTARLRVFLPAGEVKALNRGIVIARKYESANCQPRPGQPCPAITGAAIGQNVRVRLTLVAPTDLYFVKVTDPLPGGAEAIDTSLKTSQQVATETELPFFGGRGGWGWWWFSHTELRDDHAALFASYLPAGTYEYTYLIRPSIAGVFQVMPAHVEQTYFPETFGRSDGAQFTVSR